MGTKADRYREQIEALNEEFASLLPGRLEEIESLWRRLSRGEWDADRLGAMRRRVHLLSGSSSTFGFPELGRAATALERRLRNWGDLRGTPAAAELEEGAALVAELRRGAER